METPAHVSPSQLNAFTACGLRWYFRYVEKLRVPPGFAAHRGSGVHGAAEADFRQKVASRVDIPRKDMVDAAAATFEARFNQDGVTLDTDEAAMGLDKAKGAALDETVRCADCFATDLAPRVQPVLVEQEINVPFEMPGRKPIILKGVVDNIAMLNPADEAAGECIRDLKTKAKTPSKGDVDTSVQLGFYALLYRQFRGRLPAAVQLDTIVALKGGPKYVPTPSTRDDADLQIVLWRVDKMLTAIEKDVFLPADPGSWICSERWCGYHSRCPAVAHRNAVQVDMGA
jgi:putative RecB family exonuclease